MTQTMTLAEQAAAFRELETEAAVIKKQYEAKKLEADEAELRLFERMEQEQSRSFNHDSLRVKFVRAETPYGQVQDASEFIKWAEDNAPELLEVKARAKLVNEIARKHLDDGEPLPPGLGFYVKQYVSQRAS